jgi:hypothetical protein
MDPAEQRLDANRLLTDVWHIDRRAPAWARMRSSGENGQNPRQ